MLLIESLFLANYNIYYLKNDFVVWLQIFSFGVDMATDIRKHEFELRISWYSSPAGIRRLSSDFRVISWPFNFTMDSPSCYKKHLILLENISKNKFCAYQLPQPNFVFKWFKFIDSFAVNNDVRFVFDIVKQFLFAILVDFRLMRLKPILQVERIFHF